VQVYSTYLCGLSSEQSEDSSILGCNATSLGKYCRCRRFEDRSAVVMVKDP
jgi:hypothetical protein